MQVQKRIIIKVVEIRDEESRRKAMKTAAARKGVWSVWIEGGDKVVVIGADVDIAKLAKELRRKLGHARIDIVQDVGPDGDHRVGPTENFGRDVVDSLLKRVLGIALDWLFKGTGSPRK